MAFENFDLSGKTALITGAAGLLGIEHARALLESGGTVVLTDLSRPMLDDAYQELSQYFDPAKILLKAMNVTNSLEIREIAKDLQTSDIRVDILVNNAAVDPKVGKGAGMLEASRLESFPIEQWDKQLSVGLTGAFLCSQVFGSAMAQDGKGGVILNIASDLSVLAPDQRLYRKDQIDEDLQPVKPVTYSVVKAGLVGLTRYLATYWADKNVRCNALSPGGIFNGQDHEFVHRLSSLIPLGRMAHKNEYRPAVQFLCSDAAKYMNGQNVVIDGGRSVG